MPEDVQKIVNILTNSGFEKIHVGPDSIYFLDPSCILPVFDKFLEYAWLAILVLIAIMILGWSVLYIKNGIKINTVFNNAKTLMLVLCILGAVKPIVNIIYGKDLFSKQCEVVQVSKDQVYNLLNERNKRLGKEDLLYETFNVIDSGPILE